MPAAHAALFEDDEARRAILDLRQKVERQRGEIQQVGGEIQQIQRSLLDQQNQFEKLSAEIARLRGEKEQLSQELRQQQDAAKTSSQSIEERLRKFEPTKVMVDGSEFFAEPSEIKFFEDSLANTRALVGAKDVQEFAAIQQSLAQPAIEKAVAFSKDVYEVASQTNAELSKLAEARVADMNANFVSVLDKAAKNAPAGSDVAVAAVKSMITAANSAYDSFNKVAKQATDIAEANVAAATETVKGLAKAKKVA
jgi:phasin family protein